MSAAMDKSGNPAPRSLFAPPLRVELVGDGERGPRFLGYVANLSATGAFLQCASPRELGTRLKLKIHSRHSRRPLYAEVEVRWARGMRSRVAPCPGMGVQFLELPEPERRLLSRWLFANEQAPRPGKRQRQAP
jgi:hypothetical protein